MQLLGDDRVCSFLRVEQLFEQRAAQNPHQTAVIFESHSVSYGELSQQTTILAAKLKQLGVRPGTLVAICMDRGRQMVDAMLAVFKAGGAYLPIDPAFPADRISFMLADSCPLVVLTQANVHERLHFKAPHVFLVDAEDRNPHVTSAGRAVSDAAVPANGNKLALDDDLAYILYTSGSTGKPKGVQISHRALTNLLTHVASDIALTSSDVFLATSTISFDISLFEILAPLISGAQLVVAPRSVAISGELLSEAIRVHRATMLQATPSGWRILLESGWEGHSGLTMLSAGEPLDLNLAKRLLVRGDKLWNLYGPTEATIYATAKQITRDQTRIAIGKPLTNYTAYVLDEHDRPVASGEVGELHIGGIGVAIGYLKRPELTSEKFIPDHLHPASGRHLYRTGDRARFLPNGEIEALGRADNQIKLRGHRIELGEIEAVLEAHPSVCQAIVKVVSHSELDQRLIAYIIPQTKNHFSEDLLRQYASQTLPAYMLPGSFVLVESFPLTPNGKIDRSALTSLPEPAELDLQDTSSFEQTVVNCWKSILGLQTIDPEANFFYIGGHSILAIRACSELSSKLGFKIPVSWLLESPTAHSFAERLETNRNTPTPSLVAMQTLGSKPPLYLIHHLLGDILVYRSLAQCFAPDRPVFGLQAPDDFLSRRIPYPLSQLASEYVGEILARQSSGPFHIVGYSSGVVLAFEMARQLLEAGHSIGLLGLIDGDITTGIQPASKATDYLKVAVRKVCKVVFKFADETRDGLKMFVARRVGHVRFLLQIRRLEKSVMPPPTINLEQALKLTENAYLPSPYPGSALLLRFHDEAARFGPNPLLGWGSLVNGGIKAIDVPGGHITGMNPERAPYIAAVLKEHLREIEAVAETTANTTHLQDQKV